MYSEENLISNSGLIIIIVIRSIVDKRLKMIVSTTKKQSRNVRMV